MDEVKKFANWIIIHTEDVYTIGACRRYKGRIYNVDELYEIFSKI